MPLLEKVSRILRSLKECLLVVKVYSRDVKVQFSSGRNYKLSEAEKERRLAKRSRIVKFSERSARRLRFVVRNSEALWKSFITLTYPEVFTCDGRETKSHLNAFLQYLRRKSINYVWVLEFQTRGAPHYHVIVSDFVPKEELSLVWYRIVGSGDEKHLKAGTGIETIKSKDQLYGYLSNYIKKIDQKTPPEEFESVGRFWGSSRNLLAYEAYQKIGHFDKLARMIKLLRRWRKAHLRQFGRKWRWKGEGFTALDGTSLVKQVMSLRM
jgi:hypothetical protein